MSYRLDKRDGVWTLLVDLDDAWLSDGDRVYPVIVDPSYYTASDDTFVSSHDYANQNNSGNTELLAGTWNGGGDKNASYLHFPDITGALHNKYIKSANLNVYNTWSWSCTAKPLSVYKVTQSWAGSTTKTWPGPSYESTALVTKSFAHGYDPCGSANAWESLTLPASRVMKWAHGTESFYGLTLRASTTDKLAWKRFSSSQGSHTPYLDITYADQGATYSFPAVFDPPVTATTAGKIAVRVTNFGTTTWTPTNNYKLQYKILNSSGTAVQTSTVTMPSNVAPHQSVDLTLTVNAIATIGTYTLRLDMTNSGGSFNSQYGVPFGSATFTRANGAPYVASWWPLGDTIIDTVRPTLWAQYYDPDNSSTTRWYQFEVCGGYPNEKYNCQASGTITNASWQPNNDVMTYDDYGWYRVRVSDTAAWSLWTDPITFTAQVKQPPVTSHLQGAADGQDMPGVNPRVGNFSTTVTDATVGVVGPELSVVRTYNSLDPRTDGAFGAGWVTPWDQRLTVEDDGNALVTAPTGLQIRFGHNYNDTYTPPPGTNLALVHATFPVETWTLVEVTGTRRVFDTTGRVISVTDGDGLKQTLTYSSGKLSKVTDVTSGRALHVTWTGSHVTSVSTDAPSTGQPVSTWNYTYTGNNLTSVCGPLGAGSCVTYGYQAGSFYRTLVTDGSPAAYWPLGETDNATASNVVAGEPGKFDGTYANVTLGAAGDSAGRQTRPPHSTPRPAPR
ncbi:DUF6531 domain-containing protein [Luedemannella flava]